MRFFEGGQIRRHWPALGGMILVAFLAGMPLLVEPMCHEKPLHLGFVPAYTSAWAVWGTKIGVLLVMLLSIKLCVQDRSDTKFWVVGFCMAAAIAMVVWHWIHVDTNPAAADWQKFVYLDILNHVPIPPHNLRPLPYGFARLLEWTTHDWFFSCMAYRWFFSFWFLLTSYRFAHVWLSPKLSAAVVGIMVVLYYYSVQTYYGQLTDPLSHWLFVMALIFVVEDQWFPLAVALGTGVLAKETAMLIVPGYLLCWRRNGWPALQKTAALAAACAVAFFAVRLPYGWGFQYQAINGAPATMLWKNVKTLQFNYIHIVLFFLVFIPLIAYNWRNLDGRLKVLCLTLTPLILISNFWFSWVYESRNYMPLVPLLASSALATFQRAAERQRQLTAFAGPKEKMEGKILAQVPKKIQGQNS